MVLHTWLPTEVSLPSTKLTSELFNDKNTSDFVIQHGETQFHVHQWILSFYSPVFRRWFTTGMKEEESGKVDLSDHHLDAESLKSFLKLLYCFELNLSPEKIYPVYAWGHYFDVQDVTSHCIRLMKQQLDNPALKDRLLDILAEHEDKELMQQLGADRSCSMSKQVLQLQRRSMNVLQNRKLADVRPRFKPLSDSIGNVWLSANNTMVGTTSNKETSCIITVNGRSNVSNYRFDISLLVQNLSFLSSKSKLFVGLSKGSRNVPITKTYFGCRSDGVNHPDSYTGMFNSGFSSGDTLHITYVDSTFKVRNGNEVLYGRRVAVVGGGDNEITLFVRFTGEEGTILELL
ncbi:hypothetical protein P9112_006349 [Eukaryota sp. TZLM1-RC]